MTVGLVIVSHSTQLARGAAELAAQMAHGHTAIIPAGGASDEKGGDILGTSADRILQAIQEADSGDGALVLLDMGSAILSAEMALEFLDDEQRQRILMSYAPLVEGAIAAALEASLGHSLAVVKRAAEQTGQLEQLLRLKPVAPAEDMAAMLAPVVEPVPTESADIQTIQLTITNPTGLHARPASLFVQTSARFQAAITIESNGRRSDASSLIGVLSLGIRQGNSITIHASGSEASAALAALRELVEANFYETASAAAPSTTVPATSVQAVSSSGKKGIPNHTSALWHGTPSSAGVALGPALLYTSSALALEHIEKRTIVPAQVPAEQQRLREALKITQQELELLAQELQQHVGKDAAIFSAQALMLSDSALLDEALSSIAHHLYDAASALADVAERQATVLAQLGDPLFVARATDVRDAASRAIDHLREQRH